MMISKDNATKRRNHAEEIARGKASLFPENIEALSPEEIRQMLHELRVHQIELDIQNEELRLSQSELEASRARYFNFYDMAPVGYFTLSEKGLILEANLTSATFLGVDRGALVNQPFSRFIHQEDQDIFYLHLNQFYNTGKPQKSELRMKKADGALFWANLASSCGQDSGGAPVCLVVLSDITERRFREDDRELTAHLITLINTPGDINERMSDLTVSLQGWSGCEAVGIRLRSGEDYPYYETRGFPPEFVQAEKFLCAHDPDGKILRDGAGNPLLECMCGNVLCGRFDPAKPFFTNHGSFWSNSTTALLAATTEADRQARTRNRCNGMGYESVALIPLRTRDQVFGLIQFNDHRPNRFTPDLIDHFESVADSLAIALSHRQTEETLRESEERFRKLFQYHAAVKLVIDPDTGEIVDANEAAAQFYGWPLEHLKHMRIQQINVLPADTVKAEMEKAVTSESNRFEFRHRRADGTTREVAVFTNKIEISGKKLLYSIIQDVTERKRAEKILNLHMAIMETVAEGIFLIGLEDNIIKWTNSKFEKLFGYGPGELVGMHVDTVNAPTEKTPTETRTSIVDILRQTGEWHGEIKNIRKNGTHFWCYIHVSLFNHPEFGTVMVSAHTDINDRKQAEEALQESELRFRTMANAMPQLAWTARSDGHIFWYNQRWYDYTGTVPEQMEGWGWQSIHDPKVLPKVLARWQASLATGEPFDMTFPLRGADGVFRPFLTRVIPLRDNAGRVMQWFGTNTDISELKRVEKSLRESEALYRSIGESIDYGVWVCASDGRNTYASESFLRMVGITQEQCSNFGWGDLLHPDDAERTIAAWRECVRTGGKWDIEHRFRGTDGRWHYVLARGVPVRNEQGKIINWAGINLDINQLKQAEEQLRASLAEKEVLIKEVHHRVKNNLQIISSLVSLQADSMTDEKLKGVLSDVRDRVRTMALVHEKLYQTEELARLDFAEYAPSLLNYLWSAHGASTAKISLDMMFSPLILPVETAVNCGLILNELASNAIKHAFPDGGGGEVTVTLDHDPATGAVCLRVRDNGIGLSADLDRRKSATLGLRLVHMLAGQMRGTVQTGPGPGTEFQIRFKVKENSS
jgi:PAS domain S-box-containing protein